jgi:rhodanese-related sulfurtransferase
VADLDKYLAYIPKDRHVVVISNHAHRAIKAADLLRKSGFKVAGVVGALDYADEGGVLVGKKAPPKVAAQGAAATQAH